jgi:flagellar biosynthesis protein FliR
VSSSEPLARDFIIFTLILVRVASMTMIAPFFSMASFPWRGRIVLAVALAMLIAPLELSKQTAAPTTLVDYGVQLGAEALIGLTLGLGIMLLFAGIQMAGSVISQMSGLQMAEVFEPGFNASVPVFSQLLFYVTLAVFVTIGGHRNVLEAVLDTFVWMPAGQGTCSRSATEAATSLLTQSFVLGVRAAAPAMLALLLSTLILGLISRSLPQLGVIVMGFGINTVVTLAIVSVSLGATAWIFEEHLAGFLDTLRQTLQNISPSPSG